MTTNHTASTAADRSQLVDERTGRAPALKSLDAAVEILGPPFTRRYLRDNLARGIFRGLGRKYGQLWYLTDDDMVALLDRMRPEQPQQLDRRPSGVSSRSRRLRASA